MPTHSALYQNSFLPSVIKEWNALPIEARHADSIASFKRYLNRDRQILPKYLFVGNRKEQIYHARLRRNCSSLNHHLFLKNISESPSCRCGSVENTHHYFLICPFYTNIRTELIETLSPLCKISVKTLLHGDASLPFDINKDIVKAVQTFILRSDRF